ncbi:MAG: OadG family transporter subunit [Opitutales bacterium]
MTQRTLWYFATLLLSTPWLQAQEAVEPLVEEGDGPWGILWGFVFVVVVLALFAGITQVMGMIFVARDRAEKERRRAEDERESPPRAASTASPEGASPPATQQEGPPPHVLAVIAAAIHTTLHEPVRIVSIRQAPGANWAAEGRRQIAGSHRVR